MGNIYKICDADLWDSAEKIGRFTGAEIDLKDGFIHFSTADQLAETLRLHFAGRDGLRLITVDASVLDIQWEPAQKRRSVSASLCRFALIGGSLG